MLQYDRSEERTGMQESVCYGADYDLQCDFVMVYGFHDLEQRIAQWKAHGYGIHLMTGVSWGEYQDYLYGKFDGIDHHDEGQVDHNGKEINHGVDVPYMVPSVSFARYLTENLKKAVDAGVEAIHLEEPEFWVHAGYSEAFKREWQIYYKEPWQDPQASAEGQYRASQLKRYLYTRTLDRLCSELKEYALVKYGRLLRFYVPTHSLVNYSQWKIVSPESALIDLPTIDGYIAQIWTGTARVKNCYRGLEKERTFETAFLEYGVMQELVRGTGRKMWYLADPIEDDPEHTWRDYRDNYYRTVVASLFHPEVDSYEIAPWPHRIMRGTYPSEDDSTREKIPPEYKTNLLTVTHTLRDMRGQPSEWLTEAAEVGVMLADSCMYQRIYPVGDPEREESFSTRWSAFYGLAMPLLKQGFCVRPLQLDNVRRYANYLDGYRTIVLSYEFMKPDSPDMHNALAQWVRSGGRLLVVGDGSDCFHKIRAWWDQGGADYQTPTEHLFAALGLGRTPNDGVYAVENGFVGVFCRHPAAIARESTICEAYLAQFASLLASAGCTKAPANALVLRRGPYTVVSVLEETGIDTPCTLEGRYVDLFDHALSVVTDPSFAPGTVRLLRSLDDDSCGILAASGRVSAEVSAKHALQFTLTGPSEMTAAVRIRLPDGIDPAALSASATVSGEVIACEVGFEPVGNTALLTFASSPDGVEVTVEW